MPPSFPSSTKLNTGRPQKNVAIAGISRDVAAVAGERLVQKESHWTIPTTPSCMCRGRMPVPIANGPDPACRPKTNGSTPLVAWHGVPFLGETVGTKRTANASASGSRHAWASSRWDPIRRVPHQRESSTWRAAYGNGLRLRAGPGRIASTRADRGRIGFLRTFDPLRSRTMSRTTRASHSGSDVQEISTPGRIEARSRCGGTLPPSGAECTVYFDETRHRAIVN